MSDIKSRKLQAKILRLFRKIHRVTGATLFLFFAIIAITGILLGWKNVSNGAILPISQTGTSKNLSEWISIDQLHKKAITVLQDSISNTISLELSRIDIRKEKGMVKFIFEDHLWEVQLDGATGNLLQLQKRHSDFFENLHDGTILDKAFGTNKLFKVLYTSIMGLALMLFTVTGFWLWYGPKKLKKKKLLKNN